MKFTFITPIILLLSVSCPLFADRIVNDALGNSFTLNSEDFKVVCLSPSVTESIFAIGAGDRIAACSKFCRFPKEAESKPKVGGFFDTDFEKIAAINPRFVVIPETSNAVLVNRLRAMNIDIFFLNKEGLRNIAVNLRLLGDLMNRTKEAKTAACKIENAIESNSSNTFLIKRAFLMFDKMAAGKTSFAGEALAAAGFENCSTSDAPWPIPNPEFIISSNPQILILEKKSTNDEKTLSEYYRKNPIWRATDAVKHNRIYFIDSDLISIPGPRMADAVNELASIGKKANASH